MEKRTVIYREGDFSLVRTEHFEEDVIDLFNQTIWGSEGALYEHKEAENQVGRIHDPVLVELRKGMELIGTCLFVRRNVVAGEMAYQSQYVRYLVTHPTYRGQGLMMKYAALTMKIVREFEERPTAFVGIVERKNKRSYHIVESVDYHPLTMIKTLSFSRFFPRSDRRAGKIRADEKNTMRSLLGSQYGSYSFWHTENLFVNDDFYVLREGGEIVAAVQAFRAHWVIRKLPGLSGKMTVTVLPWIPIIRRVFNPSDFNFAAFDYIYCKDGHIRDLVSLFSSVLKKMGVYSALYWLDEKSPLCKALTSQRLGMLERFSSGNDAYLMVGFENLNPEISKAIADMPAFLSGGDFI